MTQTVEHLYVFKLGLHQDPITQCGFIECYFSVWIEASMLEKVLSIYVNENVRSNFIRFTRNSQQRGAIRRTIQQTGYNVTCWRKSYLDWPRITSNWRRLIRIDITRWIVLRIASGCFELKWNWIKSNELLRELNSKRSFRAIKLRFQWTIRILRISWYVGEIND